MRDPIPISALQHFMYCERKCALVHVDGVWNENEHTVRGEIGHRRADHAPDRVERGKRVIRAMPLFSERFALTGRVDVVELDSDGGIVPVEYKMGRRRGLTAHVQLCAQALCLEEMLGVAVQVGAIWFGGPRRRFTVLIDDALRGQTIGAIEAVHSLRDARRLPPAPDDARCRECQLEAHCLPGVVAHPRSLASYARREVFACAS